MEVGAGEVSPWETHRQDWAIWPSPVWEPVLSIIVSVRTVNSTLISQGGQGLWGGRGLWAGCMAVWRAPHPILASGGSHPSHRPCLGALSPWSSKPRFWKGSGDAPPRRSTA